MKVVINVCYGGFGLSMAAYKRLAELQGRECHFFTTGRVDGKIEFGTYEPITEPSAAFFYAFDIPNPNGVLARDTEWYSMTLEEKREANSLYEGHAIGSFRDDRGNPLLVQVVEELGEGANGSCAKLKIVDVPDDVQWKIEEYDGFEHVAEEHQTWG